MLFEDTARFARFLRHMQEEFNVGAEVVKAVSRAVESKALTEERAQVILGKLQARFNNLNDEIFDKTEAWAGGEPFETQETYFYVGDEYENDDDEYVDEAEEEK